FIALQAIYFLGAVCGTNVSASKSMACCRDGQMGNMPMHDSGSSSCCSHCDMGKNKSVAKMQRGIPKEFRISQPSVSNQWQIDFGPATSIDPFENSALRDQTFTAYSPPRFVLNQQFLI